MLSDMGTLEHSWELAPGTPAGQETFRGNRQSHNRHFLGELDAVVTLGMSISSR
jgi:hypothetical protein